MTANPKLTYTLADVAEMVGWTAEAIRRGCRSGRFKYTRIGRSYQMTMTQIEAMLASLECGGTAQPANELDEVEEARQANIARLMRRGAA